MTPLFGEPIEHPSWIDLSVGMGHVVVSGNRPSDGQYVGWKIVNHCHLSRLQFCDRVRDSIENIVRYDERAKQ